MAAWARSVGANGNLSQITDAFIDFHRAKGSVFKDWTAAWRTWVRNEIKFSRKGTAPKLDRTAAHNMAVVSDFLSRGDDQ